MLSKTYKSDVLETAQQIIFDRNCDELTALIKECPIQPNEILTCGNFYSRNCFETLLKGNNNFMSSISKSDYGQEDVNMLCELIKDNEVEDIIDRFYS